MRATLFASFVLFTAGLSAQIGNYSRAGATFINQNDVFGTRVFVENRGQFSRELAGGREIKFALDNGLEKIYFTTSGLVYEQMKAPRFTRRERERLEQDPHYKVPQPERFYVNMTWQNANEDVTIEKSEPQGHYISYGEAQYKSRTFKKLLFKNVYKNIDIEYVIPGDKSYGIKYNVIAHPGADLSQVKILYDGDVNKISLTENGDVLVETNAEAITEHAPATFYKDGSRVRSSFGLEKNVITFQFPSGYDSKKEVVVDPWVTTISTLTSNNYGYDVDYDFAGNTYIYGGYNPFKVARYSNTGVLQWTFAGTVGPPANWSTSPIVSQASNFAVNKYNSKTYIGQGYVGNGNRVIRLDGTGAYDNFINTANSNFQEVWDMGFHCTNDGEVFVLGGGTSSNISAVTINPTTAVISLQTFQPSNTGIAQDVASHAIDDAGKIFVLYAGSAGLNNQMCLVNNTFNGNVWTQPTTFTPFSEQGNKSSYVGAGSLSSNGFNALAVNANYLFYYDGSNLSAYNKATGALVVATTISGQTIKQQGGIAVDDCNNLYLGGNNTILSYNFNGTAFSAISTISLNLSTTNKFVYDIKLDKNGKLLYVCGSGFVGVYSPVNSLACPTASSICFNYQLLDHIICAGTTVTLSSTSTQTLNNPGYTLQPVGLTNTTGSFAVSPTVTTTYTIYLSGTNNSQGVVTSSAVSHVSVFPQPSVAPTVTQASCTNPANAFNLNLGWNPPNANPSYTITWAPLPNGINTPQQTSVNGTITAGVYHATVTADWGCIATTSFVINGTPAPSVFNIIPTGPYVLTCYKPSISFSMNPATYNYTTTNQITAAQFGPNPSITFTNSQGTYMVVGENPTSGCVSTQTFVVTQNTFVPTSALTPTFQNITCTVNSIQTITASISPTVNIEHQWISPQNTTLSAQTATAYFVPGGPGVYQHCAVNLVNGCRTCKTFTVTSNDGFPTFTIQSSPANFTLGCSTKSVTTIQITNAETQPTTGGSISYTLLAPNFAGTVPNGTLSTLVNYPVSVPGNYTVITRDNSNTCDTKVYVSVVMNTVAPMIDTLIMPYRFLTCTTPTMVLQGLSSTPNVFEKWVLPGNVTVSSNTLTVNTFTSNTTQTVVGTYTYHVLENNNLCTNQQTVTVLQTIIPPIAAIGGLGEISCKTESVTLSNISSSRVPPYFNPNNIVQAYMWTGPSPQVPLQASSNYVAYMPGTYTMIARDLTNGCFAVTTKTIADNRDYPLLNRPTPTPVDTVLDCGAQSTAIIPRIANESPNMSYTWVPTVANVPTGDKNKKILTGVVVAGEYQLYMLNNVNGCLSQAFFHVGNGTLQAGFVSDKSSGYAPLTVSFTNTSRSTIDTNKVRAVWNFGNGHTEETSFSGTVPKTQYTQGGTYQVTMYVFKGKCADTVVKYIDVEMPSGVEIPNVFTPNGDGVNDLFFLNITNISKLQMTVYDRWGNLVYDLTTEKGNVEWDGKNQHGKPVAEGVYMYVIKAAGKDGTAFEQKGNITLVR